MIFGIIAINFFKGQFYYCVGNIDGDIDDVWDCINRGGAWVNRDSNFDNVIRAIVTLFHMATTVGWVFVMQFGVDVRGINLEPKKDSNKIYAVYFVIFIIIGSFFLLNLFIGVVITKFNNERERLGKNFLLTDKQKTWVNAKLICLNLKPKKTSMKHSSRISKFCYSIASKPWFDIFIFTCIMLNSVVLTMSWYNEPLWIDTMSDMCNNFFAVVFLFEAILKLTAYGCKDYFKDGWNQFDFTIVMGTVIGFVLVQAIGFSLGP
jgi:hypothetical protein